MTLLNRVEVHMIAGGQGASQWVASVLSIGQGKSSVLERRGEWFSKVRKGFNFESGEFLILSILAPKTMILRLKTGISGTIIIARILHESPAATTDMAVLPGVLGCRTLRRTVQVRLGSNTLWLPGVGSNTLWLPGGTTIFTVSPQQFMKHSG
jgi:hypothetical protein